MLGRHRNFFNREVLGATHADTIGWLDFPSGELHGKSDKKRWDREWQHLNFLPETDPAREAWSRAWPTHRKGPHWDAIGKLRFGEISEWLLVEAKANIEELSSTCGAKTSQVRIRETLDEAKKQLGVDRDRDWMNGHYQFCNRIAALELMNRFGTPARLLYVYFYGDAGDNRRTCPPSKAVWEAALRNRDDHVGLPPGHHLAKRIHHAFVDASARVERDVPVPHYIEDGQKRDVKFWSDVLKEDLGGEA